MRSETLWEAFGHAFRGLGHAFRTQRNLKIQAAIALAVLGAGLWLRLDLLEWGILILAMGLVFVAEIMNTAIEAMVGLASPQVHPLAGIAKDASAAAVVVAVLASVVLGLMVLGPPLLERLRR